MVGLVLPSARDPLTQMGWFFTIHPAHLRRRLHAVLPYVYQGRGDHLAGSPQRR